MSEEQPNTTDVKKEEQTPSEEPSTPEEKDSQPDSEVVTTPAEDSVEQIIQTPEEVAEDLLSDGTPKDKKVTLSYDKFQTLNEKAKLYEASAPIIENAEKNPEVIETIKADRNVESLALAVNQMQEEKRIEKQQQIKSAVTDACRVWPDFQQHWTQVKPLAEALQKQGVDYRTAIQNSYFLVNPDAKRDQSIVQAQQAVNKAGIMQPSGGKVPTQHKQTDGPTDTDKSMAAEMGVPVDMYMRQKSWLQSVESKLEL